MSIMQFTLAIKLHGLGCHGFVFTTVLSESCNSSCMLSSRFTIAMKH